MKIYLLQLVILMSLSLNLQAQNLSGTIRGKVTCHGKGLQGVVVTDGIDCVLTNKSGEYVLAPQRDARFVYLSVPSGYQPKTEKTIPLFHQQIEMDKQDGYNFELMKNPQNDANHLFLAKDFTLEGSNDKPQILIYHTHSQEEFSDYGPDNKEATVIGIGDRKSVV